MPLQMVHALPLSEVVYSPFSFRVHNVPSAKGPATRGGFSIWVLSGPVDGKAACRKCLGSQPRSATWRLRRIGREAHRDRPLFSTPDASGGSVGDSVTRASKDRFAMVLPYEGRISL